MKLLLFSDLHADIAAARRLAALAQDADALVGAGDFGRQRHDVDVCFAELKSIDRPAILVPGNNESVDELKAVSSQWKQATVLHGSGVTIQGVPFFGIGGGVPVTPFGAWSYDFTEEEAAEMLRGCPEGCVLVSHSPPKGAADRTSRGESMGSTAVRDAILRARPRLVVCGHVHDSWGRQETVGSSPVVNAGPAGVFWEADW